MPPIESKTPAPPEKARYELRETSAGLVRAPQGFDDNVVRLKTAALENTKTLQEAISSGNVGSEKHRTAELQLDDAVSKLDNFVRKNADQPFVVRVPRGKHEATVRQRFSERGLGDLVQLFDKQGFSEASRLEAVHRLEAKGYQKLTSTSDTATIAEGERGILSDYYYLPPRERSPYARGLPEREPKLLE